MLGSKKMQLPGLRLYQTNNPKGRQIQEERRLAIEKENILLFNKIKRIYHYRRKHSYLPVPRRELPTTRHPSLLASKEPNKSKLTLTSKTPKGNLPARPIFKAAGEYRPRHHTENNSTTFKNSLVIGDERYLVSGTLANELVKVSIEPTKSRDRYDLSLQGEEAARLYSDVQGDHSVLCSFLQKRKGKVELVLMEDPQEYDYEQVNEVLIE